MLQWGKKLQITLFLTPTILVGLQGCSPAPSPKDSTVKFIKKPAATIQISDTTLKDQLINPEDTLLEETPYFEEDSIDLTQAAPKRTDLKYPKALELAKEYQLEGQPFTTITTKKAETLMMVSFKLYGDYRLWMNIYHWNQEKLGDSLEVSKGTVLRIKKPAMNFKAASGRPYFIKSGDSLSRISEKVYGKWKWWHEIHKNNPHQIRDPNLIFAGFTLFYKPFSKVQRKLASKTKSKSKTK